MIHYTLNQDASQSCGAMVTTNDVLKKGLISVLYRSAGSSCSSVSPDYERSDLDVLSQSFRNHIGERQVYNVQLNCDLAQSICKKGVSHPYLHYDGDTSDYQMARQASMSSGIFTAVGTCFYDADSQAAFVPIQDEFASTVYKVTNYSLYDYVDKRTKILSWVPFGTCFALVETSYVCLSYLRKYAEYSSASCSVTIIYPTIVDGYVNIRTAYTGKTLSASGMSSQFFAIQALMEELVPDPTGQAAISLLGVTPPSGEPLSQDFVVSAYYDPKATDETFRTLVRLRLQHAGTMALRNSVETWPTYDEWADLADTAIDNCKFVDINAYAFARDLRQTGSELKSLLKLIASPTNPKSWASLYLNIRYGTQLTVRDTRDLMEGLKRSAKTMQSTWPKGYSVVRSRKSSSPTCPIPNSMMSRVMNYKVCYKPDNSILKSSLKRLWDWDMYPSLQNLWDLVPYSFCVDWGGDIEKVLSQIDRKQYEELIKVLGCTYSFKDEYLFPIKLSDLGFQDAVLEVTLYSRRTSPLLHQSSLRLTTGHSSAINVVDGISLILQRMKL